MVAVAFAYAVAGAILAAVLDSARRGPFLAMVIGSVLVLVFGPSVWAAYSPSCNPFAISPQELNVLRPGISPNACRWCKTTTSARWRRHSTACKRVWPSGNDFRPRSEPMSTRPWRRGCSSRVTMSSPASAVR